VLHILQRVVEVHLRKRTVRGASPRARFGAVSFVRRLGAALNRPLNSLRTLRMISKLDPVFVTPFSLSRP
jgi:hypothetical protein